MTANQLQYQRNLETNRANLASESIAQQNADTNWQNALTNIANARTAAYNASVNASGTTGNNLTGIVSALASLAKLFL